MEESLIKLIANAFAAGVVIVVFFRMVQVVILKWIEKVGPEVSEAKERLIELCGKIEANTSAINQLINHMSEFTEIVRTWQESQISTQSLLIRILRGDVPRGADDGNKDKDSAE